MALLHKVVGNEVVSDENIFSEGAQGELASDINISLRPEASSAWDP